MIRVLHVVTDMRYGGLETMLMNYYRKIDRKKVQFDFLEHRQGRTDYDCEIEKLGGKIYRLPPLNPFGIHYKHRLSIFFKEHPEYQIIHVHQDCLSSIILKVAKKYGVKVRIAHSHSNNQDKNLKYIIKMYYKRKIPKYATYLFACSEDAGRWMFGNAKFSILHNAIDTSKYAYSVKKRKQMRSEFDIKEETLVIGHVGRFSYPKNHMYLLEVFKKISEERDAILLLVGDGHLRLEIENKINQLQLKNRVILTGVRNDVAELMQAMDAFILPSRYEGLGIVVIEAQAAGLPCIVSDKVSLECKKTELVHQMSLSDEPEKWAEKLISLSAIERKCHCEDIKTSGYDLEDNATKLMNFYVQQSI